jgi:excisionase family DNA binding protein
MTLPVGQCAPHVVPYGEAARLLSLSRATVERLVARGEIARVAISARRVGIEASEITRFLHKCRKGR